jgi:peptidyl-dipeptidase A
MRAETEKLRQLLIEIDKKNSEECSLNVAAQWNFETNVNEATQLDAVSVSSIFTTIIQRH